jgi:L-rhamnose-H+ transport protein
VSGSVLAGAGIVLFAGILQGLFAVPMKYARRWKHENIWLVFAFTGLILFPWILTVLTVPKLTDIYRATAPQTLAAVVGFGICWGTGATLTGLALGMLGIGLGMAIILGLSASVGSLIPLFVLTPEKIGTAQGHLYILGTVVMLVGISVACSAGAVRDRLNAKAGSESTAGARPSFTAGLIVAVLSGLLSSALNFVYAFGAQPLVLARQLGTSPIFMSNVITAPAVSGGFLPNLIYCGYLLRRNGTSLNFTLPDTRLNWLLGACMGLFWFGGQALYGFGATQMGNFGTVVGWPLLMGTIILASNLASVATGEWKGANRRVRALLASGLTVILLALWILSRAQSV